MWSYEIVGSDEEVLETSKPIYASAVEAQMAALSLHDSSCPVSRSVRY